MGKAIYRCTNCKKTFSRKYNAERHNTDIHNEMSVIYNKENNGVSKKRKIDNVVTSTVDASTIATEYNTEYNNNNKTMTEVKPKDPNFNFKDFVLNNEANSGADTNTDDKLVDKFLKFFEKLMPLVNELDILLKSYKKPDEIAKTISETITRSMMSQDPFKFVKDTIVVHRTEMGFIKASEYIALSDNISLHQAKIMLKALAWNSPYFKRNMTSAVY